MRHYHESLDYVGSNWYQVVKAERACADASGWQPDDNTWLCWMTCIISQIAAQARRAYDSGDVDALEAMLIALS